MTLKTPVVLILFNRPDWAKQAFERIRAAKPATLFIIADAPRDGHPGDIEACQQSLELVNHIDWQCTVSKNISSTNLGCGARIASGLSWVFDQVESAIVIEDDCLVEPTFFAFCEELLERYKNDERVLSISGTNYARQWSCKDESYLFSKHCHAWGWATWARAWKHFDFAIADWDATEAKKRIRDFLADEDQFKQRARLFDEIRAGRTDVWSFQWTFAHLHCQAFCAVPNSNLVTNIGWGENATHTKSFRQSLCIESKPLIFPLTHPNEVKADPLYDKAMIEITWGKSQKPDDSIASYILRKTRRAAAKLKRALFMSDRQHPPGNH